jgi:type I restriction enzyme S subunit
MVKLGEVIDPVQRPEVPTPGKTYRQIGVRLWGEGAYERASMDGGQTKYAQLFRAEAGDVIVNKIWARNGSVAVVTSALAGTFGSGEFPMFKPRLDRLTPSWLHWLTKTPSFWEQCDVHSRGTSGQNRIRPERFLEIEIPLPPLTEQRRIISWIEELAAQIDEARELRREAMEEAEALPLAKLSAVFQLQVKTFGLVRLEELLTEARYGSSEKCESERMEGGRPVLRIPNVALESITLNDLKFARLNERESQQLKLLEGDILVVRTNGSLDLVGRSAVVPKLTEPFAFASYMIRLRFDQARIAPDYAQRMLQHLRVAGVLVDFARTTAGQYNVSLGRLRSAEIPVPPLSEQHRIVAELDTMEVEVDAVKRLQSETAVELDALLPAILDRAFRGEL